MEGADIQEADLIPRDYQTKLMEIAIKENSIIFLPTGAGKTFIATMVLRQLAKSLEKPVCEGGKVSCMLVNTLALVEQHTKHFRRNTHFTIGSFSGDMNVDSWTGTAWREQINKHQVLVMTAQILLNILEASFLSLNDVNLIIFDECHRGVSDHCMRQIMMHFQNLSDPPRVVGLTATILNKNCKPHQVLENVRALETTFHSKIATVDELHHVLGYRTNPNETVKSYVKNQPSGTDLRTIKLLETLIDHLLHLKVDSEPSSPKKFSYQPLEPEKGLRGIINVIKDTVFHINLLGSFGGQLSTLAHMIQFERFKKCSQTKQMTMVYDSILTTFSVVYKLFEDDMKPYGEKEKVYKFSAPQLFVLLDTIREYRQTSKEPLCGIIFVQRRFTAKILYYILLHLQKFDSEFSDLTPNFMVGFNSNPYNDTRESLYNVKMNKKVLSQFGNKEINILIASNVLEEGIDIPMCTFVNRFDVAPDYRAYIQSKGRARHRDSYFYMLVDNLDMTRFMSAYRTYKQVEETLNNLFIGQNDLREGPSEEEIKELYDEHILPPYFARGPGSAHVTLVSAIALLCRYCNTLPSDRYTAYFPNWYVKRIGQNGEFRLPTNENEEGTLYKVIIELPVICPILDPIESDYFSTKKLAKRAAALKGCELLHKAGELNDMLLPKRHTVIDEDVNFMFKHLPETADKTAGNSKAYRTYSRKVPLILSKQIEPCETVYLHIIQLTPLFTYDNPSIKMMHDIYNSTNCFALLSGNLLPELCEFSLYVSAGEVNVNLLINKVATTVTPQQLSDLKEFHCLIFRDILRILKPFLVIDRSSTVEGILVVPIEKNTLQIDYQVIDSNKKLIDPKKEPNDIEKLNLVVLEETYLGKIVTPWYRPDDTTYLVTTVCTDLTAMSEFPSEDYGTYANYFNDKYHAKVLKPLQPLLLVKALSKRLNYLKPRRLTNKRNKEKIYEDLEEHLIPELCIKQDFPSTLWVQAKLLPSVLHRLFTLLQADELRRRIAVESGLGIDILPSERKWQRLGLDPHLINDTDEEPSIPKKKVDIDEMECTVELPKSELLQLVKDFNFKKLEQGYPWSEKDEPVDIERHLDVTLMDIQYYVNFMLQAVALNERLEKYCKTPKSEYPAITYNTDFVEKPIKLLEPKMTNNGPELSEVFKAITTAKGNDVVNLERSETLGDSFLKLSISLFLLLRFPQYEEGRCTTLKGRIISNQNLYYIGVYKKIYGYIKNCDFAPIFEWKPPYFCIPDILKDKISNKQLSTGTLFANHFSNEEQQTGVLTPQRTQQILDVSEQIEEDKHDTTYDSLFAFFDLLRLSDKSVADCIEGLLGVYFEACGFEGGLKLLTWLEIIPETEKIENLLKRKISNPILNRNATIANVDYFLPSWKEIEKRLGYHFKNRAFLLQALTHSSFSCNRVTSCYQKLEFLGDAVLDFLITCHIFETCDSLNPGELTDLRSALVNNITFAVYTVRCGFHKFLLYSNSHLEELMDNFVQIQENNEHTINSEVLILLEENDLYLAEHVDVPKVLGDIFEALAGAVFLDSGMDLNTVWRVFYRIMWKEIQTFKTNVPKNSIRLLHETIGAHSQFSPPVTVENGRIMVPLDFMLNGAAKRVYGFGDNKLVAKRAAAKIALRLIQK